MAERISENWINTAASLAKLQISDAEKGKLKAELERMLELADVLAELEPEEQTPEIKGGANVFREDVVTEYADAPALLANAPKQQNGCWQVPRSIDA